MRCFALHEEELVHRPTVHQLRSYLWDANDIFIRGLVDAGLAIRERYRAHQVHESNGFLAIRAIDAIADSVGIDLASFSDDRMCVSFNLFPQTTLGNARVTYAYSYERMESVERLEWSRG